MPLRAHQNALPPKFCSHGRVLLLKGIIARAVIATAALETATHASAALAIIIM